ncbi:hypothetical protein C8Q80DRAFT_1265370 [Daedaleopsis nitida]|nr:hypothetical protein C8Q80DRAFT_1265370 [Daedaleopsis nitida]
MADAYKSLKRGDRTIDIVVGGYLLNIELLTLLCLFKYKMSPKAVKNAGAIDCAYYYWSERNAIDPPSLIPVTYPDESYPSKTIEGWILPGKVAFFRTGTTPPSLPMSDKDTNAYLDTWFPRDLLKNKAFKSVRYVQSLWPRGVPVSGIVLTVMRLRFELYRRLREQRRQEWIEYHQRQGIANPAL